MEEQQMESKNKNKNKSVRHYRSNIKNNNAEFNINCKITENIINHKIKLL